MKKFTAIVLILAILCVLFAGCDQLAPAPTGKPNQGGTPPQGGNTPPQGNMTQPTLPANPGLNGEAPELGDDNAAFGESLESLNAYAGYFEGDVQNITVTCESGTPGCYKIEGNTLTFTAVSEESVYSVSGQFKGNIVIDTGDSYKFDLELKNFSLVSDKKCPILVLSGDEVSITAKKETQNYIYDIRPQVSSTDTTDYSGSIYSMVDLEVCGKGSLTLVSEYNNGVHGKDDLQVKNLNLLVACMDNALKGNDSVEITACNLILIAFAGDGIKTTNSAVSEKGNQRGNISISGANVTIYAACDGLDAAYNAIIEEDATVVNIFTDKYSNYSGVVTAVDDVNRYIRFTSQDYSYAVKYQNSEEDFVWLTAEYLTKETSGGKTFYYYTFEKLSGYSQIQYYIYTADQTPGQDQDYLVCTEAMAPNSGYDTFSLTIQGSDLEFSFTNYTTKQNSNNNNNNGGGSGGGGGCGEGNDDKGEYSTKGIKAANEIHINGGTVAIKAYDDAIHANNDTTLENGNKPTGNVIISGGTVGLYSNDDGIHADGKLTISGGTVSVQNSYEGLEGASVEIAGGRVSINASDDGINSPSTSGVGVAISGGYLYIYCTGDGIDANSRTSYQGIVISGGTSIVISNSGMNSALDNEQGYTYTGGYVLAVMPSGGMGHETTNCQNFNSIGVSKNVSVNQNGYLTVTVGGNTVLTVKMPVRSNGTTVFLGNKGATLAGTNSSDATLDENGVCWHQ